MIPKFLLGVRTRKKKGLTFGQSINPIPLLSPVKETKFIEQNQEKWAEFEDLLQQKQRDPARLNDMFVQITDDLSYARTFYPNRSVRIYLNGLAQRIFHNVYLGKQLPVGRLRRFWSHELPQILWESRQPLLVSFCLFALAFTIGIVSSMINPDFANAILGADYVAMTEENIRNGDPMGVYKREGAFGMTNYIAVNNLWVAFYTALFGVVASIGTVFLMLKNGVMVGVFQYFFIAKGVFWKSFLTIWIHGTLEISAIVIAGAAGLVAGSGLLFPGTYTRIQAFQITVRRGMKIFLGVVPIILMAAFFEGFLTRFTDTPDVVRLLFILSSLAFVLWYFAWLPRHKAQTGEFTQPVHDKELPPDREQKMDFTTIKSAGEVLADVFSILRRNPRTTWLGLLATTGVFALTAFTISEKKIADTFSYDSDLLGVLQGSTDFFRNGAAAPYLFYFHIALLAGLAVAAFRAVETEMDTEKYPLFSLRQVMVRYLALLLPIPGLVFMQWVGVNTLSWLFAMLISPIAALWAAVIYFETPNPFLAFGRTLSLLRWGHALLLGFLSVNIGILFFLFLDFPVWRMVLEFFSWLMPPGDGVMRSFNTVFTTCMAAVVTYFVFLLIALGGAVQYFSDREANDADHLHEGIARIGLARKIRGLARE